MEVNKTKLNKMISWLKRNYKDLPKSNIDGTEIVIFATGNFEGEYGWGSRRCGGDRKDFNAEGCRRVFGFRHYQPNQLFC